MPKSKETPAQRIKRLERELADEKLKNLVLNEMIDLSDRGLQYCSEVYQKVLAKNNVTPSMTDGYDCYQNALAERVNGILKQEFCSDGVITGVI